MIYGVSGNPNYDIIIRVVERKVEASAEGDSENYSRDDRRNFTPVNTSSLFKKDSERPGKTIDVFA